MRSKDLQPSGRQGQAGLSQRDTGLEKHGRGFRFYQHMLKVRQESKARSVIRCSNAFILLITHSLVPVLFVHEWPSMRIWMRRTRDILCSQPEHQISREIRARTVWEQARTVTERDDMKSWLVVPRTLGEQTLCGTYLSHLV